jgi:hypothetical protein
VPRTTCLFLGLALATAACTGTIDKPGAGGPDDPGVTPGGTGGNGGLGQGQGGSPSGSGSSGSNGGSGQGASPSGTGGALPVSDAPNLPARIRRLTTAEYDASIKAVFGIDSKFGASFTPDSRQDGFSRNDAQRVDPVLVMQLDDAAQKVAAQVKPQFQNIAQCQNKTAAAAAEACARTFLTTYATRLYRRPATSQDVDALMVVYQAGADGATYEDGLEAALHAMLMSPSFVYVTELGDKPRAALASLTAYETASAISFLITGAPPDDTLMSAAKDDNLKVPDERRSQAKRLLATDPAKAQVTRVVEEWLGIDKITETSKDSNAFPSFAGLRDAMKREADEFVAETMWKEGGTIADLFGADWSVVNDDNLARMYLNMEGGQQLPERPNGRLSLTGHSRRGIFGQAAFLSVYAHATETAPVLRGVALLRRVTCDNIAPPSSLNINVTPPIPDQSKTTRQRFAAHVSDPKCAACHGKIDPFGFSFEGLDGMGKERTKDNNQDVDSATVVKMGREFDGPYKNSGELMAALASAPSVRTCFARHMFRYSAARSDGPVQGAEEAFVTVWNGLPEASQGQIREVITAYVGSDVFMQRRADP